MAEPRILRFDEIPSIDRGGGTYTKPLAGSGIGFDGFASGITTMPKGTAIRLHTHNVDETVTVLEGLADCEIAGETHRVGRLDTSFIPASVPHRFVNVGDGQLRILWTYASTHVTRTFVETGETVEHLTPNDLGGGR